MRDAREGGETKTLFYSGAEEVGYFDLARGSKYSSNVVSPDSGAAGRSPCSVKTMPSPATIANQYSLGWIGVPRIFFIVSLRPNPLSTGIVFRCRTPETRNSSIPKLGSGARLEYWALNRLVVFNCECTR